MGEVCPFAPSRQSLYHINMRKPQENYAYIDGANLHKGVESLGWNLDYRRLRIWLKEKHAITRAYLFMGLIPAFADLYTRLQTDGYILIFKEVVYDGEGRPKGNCDADLVLRAVRDWFEFPPDRALLVSGDGDYAPLIRFWKEKHLSCTIISPSHIRKCSWLLRKTNVPIVSLDDIRPHLEERQNEKAPGTDGTAQGPSSW